jgi:hypothetical protein
MGNLSFKLDLLDSAPVVQLLIHFSLLSFNKVNQTLAQFE